VSLQQPQRPGDQIAAATPRAAAQRGDLTGADRLAVMRVLGIAQRAQHRSMLTSHTPNATCACGRGIIDVERPRAIRTVTCSASR